MSDRFEPCVKATGTGSLPEGVGLSRDTTKLVTTSKVASRKHSAESCGNSAASRSCKRPPASRCDTSTSSKDNLARQLQMAHLRIKKLELKAEADRKIREVEKEYNKLESEMCSARSLADDVPPFDESAFPDRMQNVQTYVDSLPDCRFPGDNVQVVPANTKTETCPEGRISDLAQLLSVCMSLPQRQLQKFNGNPGDYFSFIRSFNSTVARYTKDPANLLSYLIAHCEGEALEAIRRCTILEPEEGYGEALRILERRFGEPHVIARNYIEELTDGPNIRNDDHKSLINLAETMKLCAVTLRTLRYESDLNACRTLSAIVHRLPNSMQNKWCEVASRILVERREPNFNDLCKFVEKEANTAATRVVYLRTDRGETKLKPDLKSVRHHASTLVAQTMTNDDTKKSFDLRCADCGCDHYLDKCPVFDKREISERRHTVERLKLCFLCLKPNHMSRNCRSRRSCGLSGCPGKHHPLLHVDVANALRSEPEATGSVNQSSVTVPSKSVSLAVLPIKIRGPLGEMIVNALLDNGSDTTLVKETVLSQLGIKGTPIRLALTTITDEKMIDTEVVGFEVINPDTNECVNVRRALSVSSLPKIQPHQCSNKLQSFDHLRDIQLHRSDYGDISVLIGCDVPKAHWILEQRTGGADEPYAVKGPLGWVLLGPLRRTTLPGACLNYLSRSDAINVQLEEMFNFEFAASSVSKKEMSFEDKSALASMKSSMQLVDGHYQIALPWKNGAPCFPNNSGVAHKRLFALKGRFLRDSNFHEMYTAKMSEYIDKGYAELVPDAEQHRAAPNIWYLPHHGVYKATDTTKVRVVFDCAATCAGTSLNLQLRTGPDLVNSLCGVLLRFREHPLVLVADIEAMFHQVRIPPTDYDSLRFLWWPNGDMSQKALAYRMTVHPFGATSSPSCASLALQEAIECNMLKYGEQLVQQAKRSFYVDDCVMSMPDAVALRNTAVRLHQALALSGFNLTKFYSNTDEVVNHLPHSVKQVNFNLDRQPAETRRTLGIEWDGDDDSFRFVVERWTGPGTRRSLLSYVSSLFDPLGLVAPILLPAKCLIQRLCRRKADWDDALNECELEDWVQWLNTLTALQKIRIPRCIRGFGDKYKALCRVELHSFSDASESGYGAALYIRMVNANQEARCTLLLGKARVAPIKSTSIPRLELAAAVLSAKLVAFARNELTFNVSNVNLWTDSMIVLQLIRNRTSRFETFVANRLSTIHELSEPREWCYVPSKMNPADLASRGMGKDTSAHRIWFNGPDFLNDSESGWPEQPEVLDVPSELLKSTEKAAVNSTITELSWLERFSGTDSWMSLLRKVAWVQRFVQWLSQCARNKSTLGVTRTRLNMSDVKNAESTILRLVQQSRFANIICSLENRQALPEIGTDKLRRLSPFLHDGILRVGGRLQWAPMAFDEKHPIILPKDHFVSRLIIKYYHEANGHVGTLNVLAAVRERFWIVNGQSMVRRTIRDCAHCRYWHSRPGNQMMAPIPEDRMRVHEPPFSVVGVDYFGPLLVKRGRGTEKRYGCVFTCLTMRAVHLEVAHTLETDSFLCAFSRFAARRGYPSRVYSDNGTNFRGAEAELRRNLKSLDQNKLTNKLLENGCDWVFTPPKASHRGGIWERMIRSVRRIMRSIFGDQLVSDEVLQTVLAEIENILNNRPLTKLSDDPEDPRALTPNHLLMLRGNDVQVSSVGSNLTRKWRQCQHLADAFWLRWLKEYLPLLQHRQKWFRAYRNLKVGDLVLLAENARRGLWPKGIVQEVFTSKDGRVREALVRTTNGQFRRDVRQLYLLEEAEDPEDVQSSNVGGV